MPEQFHVKSGQQQLDSPVCLRYRDLEEILENDRKPVFNDYHCSAGLSIDFYISGSIESRFANKGDY